MFIASASRDEQDWMNERRKIYQCNSSFFFVYVRTRRDNGDTWGIKATKIYSARSLYVIRRLYLTKHGRGVYIALIKSSSLRRATEVTTACQFIVNSTVYWKIKIIFIKIFVKIFLEKLRDNNLTVITHDAVVKRDFVDDLRYEISRSKFTISMFTSPWVTKIGSKNLVPENLNNWEKAWVYTR